jgi:DNA replication protein DnaC
MQIVPSASGTYELAPLTKAFGLSLTDEVSHTIGRMHKNSLPGSSYKDCLTCRGEKEFKARYKGREIVTVTCNCREQWMLSRHLSAAGIGMAYQRYSWNDVVGVSPTVIDSIQVYLENMSDFVDQGVGYILWSPRTGTGKTLLASLILKEALAQGYSGYFTSFSEMLDLYTAGWSDGETRRWFSHRIQNVDFLVVDEIGKENGNRQNVVDELLDRVIRSRVANNRPIVIPTNLSPSRTEDEGRTMGKNFMRYQQGLLDLLGEASIKLEVEGENFRGVMLNQRLHDASLGLRSPVVVR